MFHLLGDARTKKIADDNPALWHRSTTPRWRKWNKPGPRGGTTNSGRTQGWSGLVGGSLGRAEYSARSVCFGGAGLISCRLKFFMSRKKKSTGSPSWSWGKGTSKLDSGALEPGRSKRKPGWGERRPAIYRTFKVFQGNTITWFDENLCDFVWVCVIIKRVVWFDVIWSALGWFCCGILSYFVILRDVLR